MKIHSNELREMRDNICMYKCNIYILTVLIISVFVCAFVLFGICMLALESDWSNHDTTSVCLAIGFIFVALWIPVTVSVSKKIYSGRKTLICIVRKYKKYDENISVRDNIKSVLPCIISKRGKV